MKTRCKFLCIASALMVLFGIVRGIGGFFDLINDTELLAAVDSNLFVIITAAVVAVLLTSAIIISSIGVLEQNKNDIIIAITLLVLFVINGLINSFLVMSRLEFSGLMINVIAAIIIISLLVISIKKQKTV